MRRAWKRTVTQASAPAEPARMSSSAWLMRSRLTTGPTAVAWDTSSMGPKAASSAAATSPGLPVVGTSPRALAGVGLGLGLALGAAPGLVAGEAEALGDPEASTDG